MPKAQVPLTARRQSRAAKPSPTNRRRARPRPGPLKDHIERVRALLDPEAPAIVALEMADADGDRTVLRFSAVRTNTGLVASDVTLDLPAGVAISYPLGPAAADPEQP